VGVIAWTKSQNSNINFGVSSSFSLRNLGVQKRNRQTDGYGSIDSAVDQGLLRLFMPLTHICANLIDQFGILKSTGCWNILYTYI